MKYFHRKFAIVKYSSYIYYIQKRLTMTIAQQLNIPQSEFPFSIKNAAGREIYRETEIGRWFKKEWDANGNKTYHEDSDGYWIVNEFDKAGNLIGQTESTGRWNRWKFDDKNRCVSFAASTGGWAEFEYNEAGEMIYHKNQSGVRLDLRPKVVVLTHAQIAEKLGIPVNLLKIAG
jgi:hypothetical protein